MKKIQSALLFGVLVWLLPFAAGFLLFPLQESVPVLFDSIMAVMVALAAARFGYQHLLSVESASYKDGLQVGILWVVICIVIDLPIFVLGMKMPPLEYAMDIGVTYAMIPFITAMIGKAIRQARQTI